jgi:hypothetical protein
VIAYRAILDVPTELLHHLSGLLAAHRRQLGTRTGRRALPCIRQALLVLIWFRKNEDLTLLAASFRISRATAYRYRDEAVKVLAATTPRLHDALHQAATDGYPFVILDGKVFTGDRCAATVIGKKKKPVHAWYSGKHRAFGANIQAVIRPDGLPLWTSEGTHGRLHDSTAATAHHIYAALYWAADQLNLPTLADAGYHGAGPGIHTPIKLPPTGGGHLTLDHQTHNQLLRSLRAPGERGFALLTQRWKALQHLTCSPSRIAAVVKAALALTHHEHRHTNTAY